MMQVLQRYNLFSGGGTLLPFADPVELVTPSTVFNISFKVYGNPTTTVELFEDNSVNYSFEKGQYNWLSLSWKNQKGNSSCSGNFKQELYKIVGWEKVAE